MLRSTYSCVDIDLFFLLQFEISITLVSCRVYTLALVTSNTPYKAP